VAPELVLPVFVSVIFFIALLVGYPWYILSAGSMLYLLSLPMGWKSYRDQAQRLAAASTAVPAEVAASDPSQPHPAVAGNAPPEGERPERLH
jgi:CDP-diacylglycerol---serine O-phosphatidyltransferase